MGGQGCAWLLPARCEGPRAEAVGQRDCGMSSPRAHCASTEPQIVADLRPFCTPQANRRPSTYAPCRAPFRGGCHWPRRSWAWAAWLSCWVSPNGGGLRLCEAHWGAAGRKRNFLRDWFSARRAREESRRLYESCCKARSNEAPLAETAAGVGSARFLSPKSHVGTCDKSTRAVAGSPPSSSVQGLH